VAAPTPDRASPVDDARVGILNGQASALVRRGLALLDDAAPGAADQALACFDSALAIRLAFPAEASTPELRYDLAGTWLNRAAVLVAMGGGDRVVAALRAYDAALAVLRALPLAADARFPRRLAIALQNRGLAYATHGTGVGHLVYRDLLDAVDVLARDESAAIPDRAYLRAATWVSLAQEQLKEPAEAAWRRALGSAAEARRHLQGTEAEYADAAAVWLTACHVGCQGLARCLSEGASAAGVVSDDVHQATDAVEAGLALARAWEARGVTRFRPIAQALLRFGTRVYTEYQPHFLDEFLAEHADAAGA
jgi:tetratricopeptide (TPR) repeat protein